MRVLILSCNTGEGHNSSGKAVQEAFQRRNIPCEMEDAFRFISSGTSSFISYGLSVFTGTCRDCSGLATAIPKNTPAYLVRSPVSTK